VIVGEPTGMRVVRARKGKVSLRCEVRGRESHSGLPHLGVNAVEAAAEAIARLKAMARRLRDEGPRDPELEPPFSTLHSGPIAGGKALNIVPAECHFEFECRYLPGEDPDALLAELHEFIAERLLPEMQAVDPACGFRFEDLSRMPALETGEDSEVVRLAQALTGANTTAKVSFGTEAGLFQEADMPAVVCGPGEIAQAHKPDEYIELEQLARCEAFLRRLFAHCR